MRTRTLVVLIAAAALSGCVAHGDAPAESPTNGPDRSSQPGSQARPSPEPPPYDPRCAVGFEPGLDPVADLARLTAACAASAGLEAVTPVKIVTAQPEGDAADSFSFRGRAGRCYRVFAVGSPEVTDLDIAVVDAEGRLAAADLSGDRFPMAPPTGFLCLGSDQVFTIQIGVMAGSGSYLVQVWGS